MLLMEDHGNGFTPSIKKTPLLIESFKVGMHIPVELKASVHSAGVCPRNAV
jgi:hypothetical protein